MAYFSHNPLLVPQMVDCWKTIRFSSGNSHKPFELEMRIYKLEDFKVSLQFMSSIEIQACL
jgi:hypothetical protein